MPKLPIKSVLTMILALFLTGGVGLAEEELLWEESESAVEVDGRTRLVVSDLKGTISLRVARPGAVRYAARTLDNQREKVPIALWHDNRSFFLRASEIAKDQPLLLEVGIPPEMSVEVRLEDSILQIGGLHNDLEITGGKLDLTLRSSRGDVELDLTDSEIDVDGVSESLSVEGSRIEGSIKRVEGTLSLSLSQSQIHLGQIADLDGEVDASSINIESAFRAVTLTANQSHVVAGDLQAGGEFRLQETPLTLRKSKGHFEIDSDDDVEFQECAGVLNVVSSYGSSVRGSKSTATVSIETNSAEITLNQMEGPTQIQGDDLRIRTHTTKDKLTVVSTSSNLQIEMAEGPVKLHNDYGDIRVRNTTKPVEIVSSGGSVLLTEIGGALEVWADGEEVQVAWTVLAKDAKGFIQNESGTVAVTLPRSAQCRVEAETEYGRIESQVAALDVSDDETTASGNLGRVGQPLIQIKSAGDLFVGMGGMPRAAN